MVKNWLPEPPNGLQQCDEIQPNENIINPAVDTSDTDEDDAMMYDGYEPLSLGITEHDTNTNDAESSEDEQEININTNTNEANNIECVPNITPIEHTLVQEVWSGPPPQFVDIEMDMTRANEVKRAMANFTLPPTNFPEWAANIPEDQWKEQLINRIQHLQQTKK